MNEGFLQGEKQLNDNRPSDTCRRVPTLTSHHGDKTGFVDIGEGSKLANRQNRLHVGIATGLPKLKDLVIHGCRGGQNEMVAFL